MISSWDSRWLWSAAVADMILNQQYSDWGQEPEASVLQVNTVTDDQWRVFSFVNELQSFPSVHWFCPSVCSLPTGLILLLLFPSEKQHEGWKPPVSSFSHRSLSVIILLSPALPASYIFQLHIVYFHWTCLHMRNTFLPLTVVKVLSGSLSVSLPLKSKLKDIKQSRHFSTMSTFYKMKYICIFSPHC